MPVDLLRRTWLLDAIRRQDRPVSTADAARLLADSPWPTAGRNTARKTLRVLTRCGDLRSGDIDGRRLYIPTTKGGTR